MQRQNQDREYQRQIYQKILFEQNFLQNILKQNQQSQQEQQQQLQRISTKYIQKLIKQQSSSYNFQQSSQSSLDYLYFQIQNNANCLYKLNNSVEFVCQSIFCDKYPWICSDQNCKCFKDHFKCKIIKKDKIISMIKKKLSQQKNKQILRYLKAKFCILKHMENILSQQRSIICQIQQSIQQKLKQTSKISLKQILKMKKNEIYLFGLNQQTQYTQCKQKRLVKSQNLNDFHKNCTCKPQKLNFLSEQDEKQCQTFDQNKTAKQLSSLLSLTVQNYSKIFQTFEQEQDFIEKQYFMANMNYFQRIIFCDLVKYTNYSVLGYKSDDTPKLQKKLLTGHVIYKSLLYKDSTVNKQKLLKQTDLLNLKDKINKILLPNLKRFISGKLFHKEPFLFISKVQSKQSKINNILKKCNFIFNKMNENQFNLMRNTLKIDNIKKIMRNEDSLKLKTINNKSIFLYQKPFYYSEKIFIEKLEIKQLQLPFIVNLEVQYHNNVYFNQDQYTLQVNKNQKIVDIFCLKHQSQQHTFHDTFLKGQHFENQHTQFEQYLKIFNLKYLESIIIEDSQILNQDFKKMKNLKKIKIFPEHKDDYQQKLALLSEFKSQINMLYIDQISFNKSQKTKLISQILKNNSQIQNLYLSFKEYYEQAKQFLKLLKNIKSLEFQFSDFLSNFPQELNFQSLKYLKITSCSNINMQCFTLCLGKMCNLTSLDISHNQSLIRDDFLQAIGQKLVNLQTLGLINSIQITGQGLIKLQNLQNLKTLLLGWNYQIQGKDIIQLTKRTKRIQKLSLYSMNICPDELLEIYYNLNYLTHLNLYFCQEIDFNCIKQLNFIKSLAISSFKDHFKGQKKQEVLQFMQQRGILFQYQEINSQSDDGF